VYPIVFFFVPWSCCFDRRHWTLARNLLLKG